MSKANKCDRCHQLYEDYDDQLPYGIVNKNTNDCAEMDLCSACKFELEDFVMSPKKFSKRKIKRNDPPETKAKMSSMMSQMQAKAKEIREKDPELSQGEALREASKRLKKGEKLQTIIPVQGVAQVLTWPCAMCGKGKFDGPHQMCGPCKEDMGVGE